MIVGQWTLHGSLGAGGFGKVYTATNSRSQVVAVKNLVRDGFIQARNLESEIQVFRDLTELAENANDAGRLLRLIEEIYQSGNQVFHSTTFDNVWLVMEPVVPQTIAQLRRGEAQLL